MPVHLRPAVRHVWTLADRTAAAFGTRLGRRYRWWRLPAAVVWCAPFVLLRRDVATWGNAHLIVGLVRPARGLLVRAMVWPVAIAGVVVVAWTFVGAVTSPSWVDVVVVPWVLLVSVEFGPVVLTAVRRRDRAARSAAVVRGLGHCEMVVEVGLLVGAGDAGVLGRTWLQHADRERLTVIADARTARLAQAYRRGGFVVLDADDPLALYRPPRDLSTGPATLSGVALPRPAHPGGTP